MSNPTSIESVRRRAVPVWMFVLTVVLGILFGAVSCGTGIAVGAGNAVGQPTTYVTVAETIPATTVVSTVHEAPAPAIDDNIGNGDHLVGNGPNQITPGTYVFGVQVSAYPACFVSSEDADGNFMEYSSAEEGDVVFIVRETHYVVSVSGCTPGVRQQ